MSQPPHIPLIRDPLDFPKIAYPTIILATCALSGLALCHHVALFGYANDFISFDRLTTETGNQGGDEQRIVVSFEMKDGFLFFPTYWVHFALRVLLTYIAFTVMHESAHDSIARQGSGVTLLNPVLGWLSAFCFGAPFSVFKEIHLDHHRYTNADGYDADLWAGGEFRGAVYSSRRHPIARFLLLPLRCATQLYHYLFHAVRFLLINWSPIRIVRDVSVVFGLILFPLASVAIPKFNYFFWCFHLPIQAAVLILGLCFDYLPHRPHETSDNPINATSLITWSKPVKKTSSTSNSPGVFSPSEIKSSGVDLLTIPLLSQNFHPIHHLYPTIPFYRYSAVYWRMAEVLEKAGLKAHPLFPLIVSCDDE